MMVFDFGYRLKNLREHKRMTQAQVAKRLGLSKTAISGYENNIKTPSLEVLIKLVQLYEASADYILGFDDRKALYLDGITPRQQGLLEELVEELRRGQRG